MGCQLTMKETNSRQDITTTAARAVVEVGKLPATAPVTQRMQGSGATGHRLASVVELEILASGSPKCLASTSSRPAIASVDRQAPIL